MSTFVTWHKKYIKWWKKKLNVSDYGILWIAFVKGINNWIVDLSFFYKLMKKQLLKEIIEKKEKKN